MNRRLKKSKHPWINTKVFKQINFAFVTNCFNMFLYTCVVILDNTLYARTLQCNNAIHLSDTVSVNVRMICACKYLPKLNSEYELANLVLLLS